MTLSMSAHIIFPEAHGRKQIDIMRVSAVHIESSWKEFTDRCEITLPRNIRVLNNIKYSEIFKKEDPVIVKLGYGTGDIPVEFTGYIKEVSEGIPVVLKCEDEMYKLKKGNVSVVSKSISLNELLKKIAPGYEIECVDAELGAVRYANLAPIKILEALKKDFGFHTYFDEKVLKCGVIYSDQSDIKPININFEKNVVNESINNKEGNTEVKIKAISILKNGKKISVEVGDKNGNSIQRTYINITATAELKKRAEADMAKYKVDGIDGTFECFGIPRFRHGLKAYVKSELFKNIDGIFYVDGVTKDFDSNGYRQTIKLGDKAQ